jgi:signal peptidase I
VSSKLKFQKVASDDQIKKVTQPSLTRELVDYLIYFLKVFLSIAIVYSFIRIMIFDLIGVNGKSMFPNYNEFTTNDAIYTDQFTPRFSEYERGDVVVLISPEACNADKELFIKRIIGLPGEQVVLEDGKVFIINQDNPAPGVELDESFYLPEDSKSYKKIFQDDGLRYEEPLVQEGTYYFMGDNRTASTDSRVCGPINRSLILGKEFFRLSPAEKRGFFNEPIFNIGRQN